MLFSKYGDRTKQINENDYFWENTIFDIINFHSTPGVGVHPDVETFPSKEEGFVLLSLPRPAADPEELSSEEALPGSHWLAGGTHHGNGWHGA